MLEIIKIGTKKNSSNTRGSKNFTISLRDDTAFDSSVPQKAQSVNTQYMQNQKNDTSKLSLRRTRNAYESLDELSRLEKRNELLEKDVKSLKQLLALQKTLTHSKELNPRQLRVAADLIRKRVNSTYNTDEISNRIGALYRWIANGQDVSLDEIYERARPIAEDIADYIRETKQTNYYYKDLMKRIQNTTFSLNEKQMDEVAYAYDGSAESFRRQNMGRFKMQKDAVPLDTVWQELASEYPGIFDLDISSVDMPLKLVEIYEGARDASEYTLEIDRNELVSSIVTDIYDKFWSVSTLETVADKKQKEINRLIALIGTNTIGITEVDWVGLLSACALSGVVTVLTCIKGLPEVKEE